MITIDPYNCSVLQLERMIFDAFDEWLIRREANEKPPVNRMTLAKIAAKWMIKYPSRANDIARIMMHKDVRGNEQSQFIKQLLEHDPMFRLPQYVWNSLSEAARADIIEWMKEHQEESLRDGTRGNSAFIFSQTETEFAGIA